MADFKVVGKLTIDDKGQLGIIANKSKAAAKGLDNTGKSARTADRNLKGAAQASSNTTKNFSKMAQGIEGGLVPAYATLAASLFAITAVFQGLKAAADLKNQQRGLELFSESTGKNMLGVAESIRQATNGIISFKEAAQAAAITTAAGFSAEQVADLAKGAKLASVALGRDMGDSFQRLIRGVTKAEPELLDELGIILRLDIATRKFADANGLVAEKLTIAQRQAAVFEEVSRQLTKNFGDFEEHADELTNDFAKLETAFMQVIKNLSEFVGPLEVLASFLARNSGAAALVFAGFVTSIAKQAFPALTNLTDAFSTYGQNAQARADQSIAAVQRATDRFRLSASEFTRQELRKNTVFQSYLKRRGILEQNFFFKSEANQKRSVRMMIVHLEKKAAAGKAINEAELANLKLVLKRMEAAHQTTLGRMVAGAQAAGAAMSTAIVAPTALAQSGLAAMATFVATRLSPVFAALGAVINGAFFIFTTVFIGKFLYDLIFLTDEMKERQDKLNSELERTDQLLQFAGGTAKNILKAQMDDANDSIYEVQQNLLRVYRLVQAVGGLEKIRGLASLEGGTNQTLKQLSDAERQNVAQQITSFIGTTAGADGFEKNMQTFVDELSKELNPTGAAFVAEKLQPLQNALAQFDPNNPDSLEGLLKTLAELLSKKTTLKVDTLLTLLDPFQKIQEEVIETGGRIADLDDATKNLVETAMDFRRKFRPTSEEAFAKAMEGVLTGTEAKGEATGSLGFTKIIPKMKDEDIAAIIRQRFGLDDNFELDVQQILAEFRLGVEATKALPGLISDRTAIDNELKFLKSKKDATSKLAAQEQQIKLFLKDEEIIKAKINQLDSGRNLLSTEAQAKLDIEIGKENEKLRVIEQQRKEYARSISLIGTINDTMSQGLEKMFFDLTMGATNFAESFRGLIKMILAEMAKIAAMRMAASTMSFIGLANGGIMPMASGGVINRANSYAAGGIATEPTYLVGEGKYNEAVVPLPNGRSIPVDMNGGSGTNVTINIDGSSTASGGLDANTGKQLGHMIQAATMEIIQREKRPGGVLSR